MSATISYAIFGYLSGSVLYARVVSALLGCGDVTADSSDGNPGTANAFTNGGFLCGVLTLLGDLGKGFLPVHLFLRCAPDAPLLLAALVLAAPVIGHAFPIFYHFRGGKAIAVIFGCLLGLLPFAAPLLTLAAIFVFFSLVVRVTPHFYRTAITYLATVLLLPFTGCSLLFRTAFLLMAITVCLRLYLSHENKENVKVQLLWIH